MQHNKNPHQEAREEVGPFEPQDETAEAPDVTHSVLSYEKAKKMSKNITEIGILKNPISIGKLKNVGSL